MTTLQFVPFCVIYSAVPLDFLTEINRNTYVSMYQLKRVKGGKLRIKQLAYLGINVVTLESARKIPFLPSLYALMDGYGPYYAEKRVMYYYLEQPSSTSKKTT